MGERGREEKEGREGDRKGERKKRGIGEGERERR